MKAPEIYPGRLEFQMVRNMVKFEFLSNKKARLLYAGELLRLGKILNNLGIGYGLGNPI